MQSGWESPWVKLRASDTSMANDSVQIIIGIGLLSPRRRVRLRVSCLLGSLFILLSSRLCQSSSLGQSWGAVLGTAEHWRKQCEITALPGSPLMLEHSPSASAVGEVRDVTGHPTGKEGCLAICVSLPRLLLGPLAGSGVQCFGDKIGCDDHDHPLHLATEQA